MKQRRDVQTGDPVFIYLTSSVDQSFYRAGIYNLLRNWRTLETHVASECIITRGGLLLIRTADDKR